MATLRRLTLVCSQPSAALAVFVRGADPTRRRAIVDRLLSRRRGARCRPRSAGSFLRVRRRRGRGQACCSPTVWAELAPLVACPRVPGAPRSRNRRGRPQATRGPKPTPPTPHRRLGVGFRRSYPGCGCVRVVVVIASSFLIFDGADASLGCRRRAPVRLRSNQSGGRGCPSQPGRRGGWLFGPRRPCSRSCGHVAFVVRARMRDSHSESRRHRVSNVTPNRLRCAMLELEQVGSTRTPAGRARRRAIATCVRRQILAQMIIAATATAASSTRTPRK